MNQRRASVPCILMRGGTSKGPFFKAEDLPADPALRNRILLDVMGSPHPLQIDGLGGARPQTSKVAVVGRRTDGKADVDFLFAQVSVEKAFVDTSPNCGNMLAGVAPFALEAGLTKPEEGKTRVRIYNVNTATFVEAEVETSGGEVKYDGDFALDGVPGTGSPITMRFGDATGAKTGRLLPTGKAKEEIDGIPVSLLDYSMPMMLLDAKAVGFSGRETPDEIDQAEDRLKRIENMRLEAGRRMGLGDVSELVIPKVGLLSPAIEGGTLANRYLTPHACHKSHAVTGGMCVAAACFVENGVIPELAGFVLPTDRSVSIEHPSGKLDLEVSVNPASGRVDSVAVVRTARKLFSGEAFLKHSEVVFSD